MNGRVYDYNVGRFLSVDPFIQGEGNSQGINPYSYIMNNPLAGIDPTGYIIHSLPGQNAPIHDPFNYGRNCSHCIQTDGENSGSENGSSSPKTKEGTDTTKIGSQNSIMFTESQIEKINSLASKGKEKGNFSDVYRFILAEISKLDRVDENITFWFQEAIGINGNDPNSVANTFIRAVTAEGLGLDSNSKETQLLLQDISNSIALAVISDITRN